MTTFENKETKKKEMEALLRDISQSGAHQDPQRILPSSFTLPLLRICRKVEKRLVNITDYVNPIMVKETRQALKSRQFVATFLVVIAACWIASIGGVAVIGPQIYYAAAGSEMLLVYYAILALPLTIIVPYSAFRSLAVEQEDNTYDLLSITALSSKQIINGKFGSAVVQMLIYLSAVSPCIAFAFLLRGVDAMTVALILGYTVLGSMGLTMLAIFAGTFSRVRYSQVLVSVGLVLGLAWMFALAMGTAMGLVYQGYSLFRSTEFWVFLLVWLTAIITTFALLHAAATAQISFACENRSTKLRIIMLVQQACFLGWMAVLGHLSFRSGIGISDVVFFVALLASIYWYLMGTFMTGEWPHLSRRVRRSLPQSTVGRMFFTWLNPGPGTGYMFCVANLSAIVATGLLLLLFDKTAGRSGFGISSAGVGYFLVLAWGYVITFLGLGRLLINVARRFAFVPLMGSFLLNIVLVMFASGIPLVFYLMSPQRYTGAFSMVDVVSPLLTLTKLVESGPAAIGAPLVTAIVLAAAMVTLLFNLRSVGVELHHHRMALPARVAEDEAALHPKPPAPPSSPWEAGD